MNALLTCACDASHLNDILESNHTMKEMNIFSSNLDMMDIEMLLYLNRKQKIVFA